MAPATSKTSATKKRKSDATTSAAASKKAKLSAAAQAETVKNILADVSTFELPTGDAEIRALILELAQYARSLEEEVEAYKPKAKSLAELKAAAEKLATAAKSGIKNQMKWRPSCKTSGARWTYDGICTDPVVFGNLLGLEGPPTFKVKKISPEAFQELIGTVRASAMYNNLYLKSDINVHWKAEEGTFKFSGTYGVL